MKPVFPVVIGGILPYDAVSIELFFILTPIWLNQFCYIFGFVFVFVFLLVTCAEITIVLSYFQLCCEDKYFWWRAYLTYGSSTVYLFVCQVFHLELEITKLEDLL